MFIRIFKKYINISFDPSFIGKSLFFLIYFLDNFDLTVCVVLTYTSEYWLFDILVFKKENIKNLLTGVFPFLLAQSLIVETSICFWKYKVSQAVHVNTNGRISHLHT